MLVNRQEILSAVDHTNLDVCAGWDQIRKLCDEAIRYHTASVCIAPSFVKQAADYVMVILKFAQWWDFPMDMLLHRLNASKRRKQLQTVQMKLIWLFT